MKNRLKKAQKKQQKRLRCCKNISEEVWGPKGFLKIIYSTQLYISIL